MPKKQRSLPHWLSEWRGFWRGYQDPLYDYAKATSADLMKIIDYCEMCPSLMAMAGIAGGPEDTREALRYQEVWLKELPGYLNTAMKFLEQAAEERGLDGRRIVDAQYAFESKCCEAVERGLRDGYGTGLNTDGSPVRCAFDKWLCYMPLLTSEERESVDAKLRELDRLKTRLRVEVQRGSTSGQDARRQTKTTAKGTSTARFKLDCKRQRVCINGRWEDLSDAQTQALSILQQNRGEWTPGKVCGPRMDKIVKSLHESVRSVVQTQRGPNGGYRLLPDLFVR